MDHRTVVDKLSRALSRDNKDINTLLEGLAAVMRDSLCDMDPVAIPGFGTFEPEKHEESVQPDLSTGRMMLLPPSITVEFRPSALLKRKLSDRL